MYVSVRNSPVAAILSFRGVAPTVVGLGFVSLLTDISSEMLSAVLPLFVVVHLGLSPFTYGVVEGVHQIGSVLARLLGGYFGDTRRPKLIAAWGYGLSVLCKLLLMAVTTLSAIMAIVALDRAGKGLRTAPRDAMIANATPDGLMGRAFGVHRAFDTLGAMLGPIVAWLLLMLVADDFQLVFFVSFCFGLMGLIMLLFLRPEHAHSGEKPVSEALKQPEVRLADFLALMKSKSIRRLIGITVLLALATISDGFLYLSLTRKGVIPTVQVPLLFVAVSSVYLITAIPMGNLADRIGRRKVFIGGYIFLLIAYLGVEVLSNTTGLAVCLIALGLYYAATDGVLSALAAPMLDLRVRSTGLAFVQAAQATGRALSALLFGVVWSFYGLEPAMWLFIVLLTTATVCSLIFLRRVTEL